MRWVACDEDRDHWPGNWVMRWLAYGPDTIDGPQVTMAVRSPDGTWYGVGQAVNGSGPVHLHAVTYSEPVAWAEIEAPAAPVLVPAYWADPDEIDD